MSQQYYDDEYEHLNCDADKYVNLGHSGKQRTKKEVFEHQNRPDPSGNVRKIITNMSNQRHRRDSNSSKH